MGQVLASLHFGVGIDGMDIELVLAGDGFGGLRCWCLDYNQCQRWLKPQPLDKLGSGQLTIGEHHDEAPQIAAGRLAKRICNWEFYYPRPHQPLYPLFKRGYHERVIDLIDKSRPECPNTAWEADAQMILAAGQAFLAKYELYDQEAVERKARVAARKALSTFMVKT
jgi:hypothetical protein